MAISFPRLDSLDAETSANYRRASKMTKKVLLAQIYQLQGDLDNAKGQLAMAKESQSLKDWSEIINAARTKAEAGQKIHNQEIKFLAEDFKKGWTAAKRAASQLSFTISETYKAVRTA